MRDRSPTELFELDNEIAHIIDERGQVHKSFTIVLKEGSTIQRTASHADRVSASAALSGMAEPVAWRRMNEQRTQSTGVTDTTYYRDLWTREGSVVEPLYAAPPASDLREENRWQPIETAPKDGSLFLACNTGSIERWHATQDGVVITRSSSVRAFTCSWYADPVDAATSCFIDEFGDFYGEDGRIQDAEDLTAEDDVLRLALWSKLPALPATLNQEGK